MRILLYCFLAMLCPVASAFAQVTPPVNIPTLAIGDTMPDITLTNVYNYPVSKIQLSNLKGKLVILDFWGRYCGTCIAQMPHLDSLRKQFSDEATILLVTQETKETVRQLFSRVKYLKELKLAGITNDTLLWNLFKPHSLPHEVWINKKGEIIAITGHEYVTAKNIAFVIAGNSPQWPQKEEETFNVKNFSINKSSENTMNNEQTTFSTVTAHMAGLKIQAGHQYDSAKGKKRFFVINHSILNLYALAYRSGLPVQPGRAILEVKDISKYRYNNAGGYYADWVLQNTYCYETSEKYSVSDVEIREIMKHKLDEYFNLYTCIEKRTVPCLLLKYKPGAEKTLTSKNKNSVFELDDNYKVKQILNDRLDVLVFELNRIAGMPPVIDETHVYGNIDLRLPVSSIANLEELASALKPYGLYFERSTRPMDMFVVTEK